VAVYDPASRSGFGDPVKGVTSGMSE